MVRFMAKNENGLALPLVLIIFLILLLLGTVLISVSTSQVKEAVLQEQRVKAHYIAYSGANAVATWIIQQFINPGNTQDAIDKLDGIIAAGESSLTTLGAGSFSIEITKDLSGTVFVSSTGYVGDSEQVVTLTLEPDYAGGEFNLNMDTAVFSNTGIELTGSSQIFGNAGTNSIQENSVSFGWSTKVNGDFVVGPDGDYEAVINPAGHNRTPQDNITGTIGVLDNERTYLLPAFPIFPENLATALERDVTTNQGVPVAGYEEPGPIPDLSGNLEATIRIPASGFYQDTISIAANTHLYIDLEEQVRVLRVKNLNIDQGHIHLDNPGENGKLLLYIEESLTYLGGSTLNNNGDISDLVIYYKGAGAPGVGGNTRLYGSIYIESADFTIAGSNGILGHIVSGGNNVNITGNAEANVRILYAPNANVSIGGSGRVRGPVVANYLAAEGNSRVFYNPESDIIDVDFPFLFEGNELQGYRKGIWQ